MPKFDVVVGNPPYKRNLHLQMLDKVFSCLKEDGEIVWLHPARWLQDPTAPFKKNSDFNKFKDLPFTKFDIIPVKYAQKYFNNLLTSDLSISKLKGNSNSILNENKIYELRNISISFKKLLKKKYNSISTVVERNKRNGIRVKVRSIIPFIGSGAPEDPPIHYYTFFKNDIVVDGKIDGKEWVEYGQKNQFSKPKGSPLPLSIKFNTIQEAQNFIDSTYTEVFQFFNYLTKLDVHVQLKYLPFMDDYTKPWTNERFQKYFDITDEELKFIKETIKEYI